MFLQTALLVLRKDFAVRRHDRPAQLIRRASAPDIREIRSHARTSLSDAVAIEALVGFDQHSPAGGIAGRRACLVGRGIAPAYGREPHCQSTDARDRR